MALVQSAGRSRRISGINVTPLVDITLVLLVVFMVTAKVVVSQALPLDLPSASQAQGMQVVFSVQLDREGQLSVNGQALAGMPALVAAARDARNASPKLRAVISADGEVPHRRVIAVLNALSKAGVAQVAFDAQAQEEGA